MKYIDKNTVIPQEKREDINEKILLISRNNLQTNITKEDIFNCYTGVGNLHGLDYKDFASYHDYSNKKKEIENGQFFTPHKICEFMYKLMDPNPYDKIADLSFGMGNFFNYHSEENSYGCEIDDKAFSVAKHLYPEANLDNMDIRHYSPNTTFKIVFGNPPFNLEWFIKGRYILSQLYYCIKAHELLDAGGFLVLITPKSFLKDDFSHKGHISMLNDKFNLLAQFELPDNVFKSVGVTKFETKIMILQKIGESIPSLDIDISKIEKIADFSEEEIARIRRTSIEEDLKRTENLKSKLFLENMRSKSESSDFEYRIRKMLYSIKVNPKVKQRYQDCVDFVHKYNTQKKPKNVSWEEYEKDMKIHETDVFSFLKDVLRKQNQVEKDGIHLVKINYGLKLKAYSEKNKKELESLECKTCSFNDMVLDGKYPFEDKTYYKLYKKKKKEFENQSRKNSEIKPLEFINYRLQNQVIIDFENDIKLILNEIQKEDLNKCCTKKYNIINWQQGGGKSLAAITYIKYISRYTIEGVRRSKKIKNSFIVSPSVSIEMTWREILRSYKINHTCISSLADIRNIKDDDIVLISYDMLMKYQRHVKKFVRKLSHRVITVCDESDETINIDAKRSKALKNVFRKSEYKLQTTGTSTRNNITELYSQLEFLYNNSINMLCECENIHEYKNGEVIEKTNTYYRQPFPAYRKGFELFKKCFSPFKSTVFGIKKGNQNIYNMAPLKSLIEKTILTRTFDVVLKKSCTVCKKVERFKIKLDHLKQSCIKLLEFKE